LGKAPAPHFVAPHGTHATLKIEQHNRNMTKRAVYLAATAPFDIQFIANQAHPCRDTVINLPRDSEFPPSPPASSALFSLPIFYHSVCHWDRPRFLTFFARISLQTSHIPP
jgi:hypothetical protein